MNKGDQIMRQGVGEGDGMEEGFLPEAKRQKIARIMVTVMLVWPVLFFVGAYLMSLNVPVDAEVVESPFKPWDGDWVGEFMVYEHDGNRIKHLSVKQTYRHVPYEDGFRQEGHFEVTDLATGKTEIERALNGSEFDGSGLRCKVVKDHNREVLIRSGSIEDGYLFWTRDIPGALETFREWVDGDTYFIEGTGIYGDPATAKPLIFVGRYHRPKGEGAEQSEPVPTPEVESTSEAEAEIKTE